MHSPKSIGIVLLIATLFFIPGCHRVPEDIEPKISYTIQDRYLKQLPSPFKPLDEREKEEPWGREYLIGMAFAHQLDLYQAITAFKRAEILVPPSFQERKLEMQYEILLCYYVGQKYLEVTDTFENSDLSTLDPTFPAFKDLLVILYDSYQQIGEDVKAQRTLQLIHEYDAETEKKLHLSSILVKGDIPEIRDFYQKNPSVAYLGNLLSHYDAEKKSISCAQTLNAILPGAGYFYLGQNQSGITALLLNGLFIAASYHFFEKGNIAAGIIFTSFEAGWYFGGIYGAGEEAKFYNERLYERYATPLMNQQRLFPILMLKYSF